MEIRMKNICAQQIYQNSTKRVNAQGLFGQTDFQGKRAINLLVHENMMLKRQLSQIFNQNPHLANQFHTQKPVLIQHCSGVSSNPAQQRFSMQASNKDDNQMNLIQNSYRQKILKLKCKKIASHQRKISQCRSAKVVFNVSNNHKIQKGQNFSINNSRCTKKSLVPQNSHPNSTFKIQLNTNSSIKSNNLYKDFQGKFKIQSKHNQNADQGPQQKQRSINLQLQNKNRKRLLQNAAQNQKYKSTSSSNLKTIRNSASCAKSPSYLQNKFQQQKYVPKPPSAFHNQKLNGQTQRQDQILFKKNTYVEGQAKSKLIGQIDRNFKKFDQSISPNKQNRNASIKQLRGNIYLQDQELSKDQLKEKNYKKQKLQNYKQQTQAKKTFRSNQKTGLNQNQILKKGQTKIQNIAVNESQVVSLQYFMKSDQKTGNFYHNCQKDEKKQIIKKLLNNVYINEE